MTLQKLSLLPLLISGPITNRLKSQQTPKGEVQSVTWEEVCYTRKELLEFSNLYRQKSREQVWEWILRCRIMVEGRWLEIWWQWIVGKRSVDRLLWAKHLKLICVLCNCSLKGDLCRGFNNQVDRMVCLWISFFSQSPPIIIQWAYEHSGGRGWTLCMGSATWASIHQGHLTVPTVGCSFCLQRKTHNRQCFLSF